MHNYQELLANNSQKLKRIKQITNLISIIRLVLFVAFVISVIMCFYTFQPLWIVISIALLMLFIGMVIVFSIYNSKVKYYVSCRNVINDYILRTTDEWKGKMLETGQGLIKNPDDFLYDLDVIGRNSLFSFLCIAKTVGGKKKLIEKLTRYGYTDDEEHKAVEELANNIDFTIDFQARLRMLRNNTILNNDFEETKVNFKLYYGFGFAALAIIIILTVLAILNVVGSLSIIAGCLLNLLVFFIFSKKNGKHFSETQSLLNTVLVLTESFSVLNNRTFTSKLLIEYEETIKLAEIGLQKVKKLIGYDSLRKSWLSLLLTNAIFPFSILILEQYQKTHSKYNDIIKRAIVKFENLEALVSLSILRQVRETTVLPNITDQMMIEATDMVHPLLNPKVVVPNSFKTGAGINIITGSNMSGKTSFMRTLAINLVLLNAGGYVCAKSFSAPSLKIFTSMRVGDDINTGVSTFYSELLRVKKALEFQNTNNKMITFVDEIFKGTNSNDRIIGAKTLMTKLNTENSIVVITTHDFEICDLQDDNVYNYHFSEEYKNETIVFDYKIRPGKCKTTNALYLMRKAGILN